ncbi:MAG: copper chaperone PCu(A)C [Gammaproteobacteria bacterium]
MKQLTAILLGISMLFLASLAMAAGKVEVRDAWIPEAPPVAGVMAAYFKIENHGNKPVKIIGASCAAFKNTMMHKTIEKDGMSRMVHLDSLTVDPKSSVTFRRGGMHLMLMQPKHAIKKGDKVAITLMTADKHKIHFTAVVKAATLGND